MADVTETFLDGTIIERDFTPEEAAQIIKDAQDAEAAAAAKEAKDAADAAARAVLLERLGLTSDEFRLLTGV